MNDVSPFFFFLPLVSTERPNASLERTRTMSRRLWRKTRSGKRRRRLERPSKRGSRPRMLRRPILRDCPIDAPLVREMVRPVCTNLHRPKPRKPLQDQILTIPRCIPLGLPSRAKRPLWPPRSRVPRAARLCLTTATRVEVKISRAIDVSVLGFFLWNKLVQLGLLFEQVK